MTTHHDNQRTKLEVSVWSAMRPSPAVVCPPGYVEVPFIVRENTTYLSMIEIKEDDE